MAEPRPTLLTDPVVRAVYSEGAGIVRDVPCAVAVPGDADSVAALVRWARDTRTPLVPRGSGSGMAGGAVGPSVVVDVSGLGAIGAVDIGSRRVTVGPGALRDAVNDAAHAHGLRLPVDPSSGPFCTIGGMAATNAAGAHTMRYGSMRAWVHALDCVFEDGSRAVVRRGAPPPRVAAIDRFAAEVAPAVRAARRESLAHAGVRKESSGYALADFARTGELVDLLVGSEGTLAVFVAIELALAPLAGATSSVLAEFPSLEAAVDGAGRARTAGASACELLDRTFLDVAREGAASTRPDTDAVLLAEVEGSDPTEAADAARALHAAFTNAGASAVRLALDDPTERELWALRHAASPILSRLDPALKSMQFIEDGAVPPAALPEYVRGVRRILADEGIRGVIFGHAGDAHVHVNPLVDVRLADWRRRVERVLDRVVDLTARLGGTLSGEHGDGRLRTPLLSRVWPDDARQLFARVKTAFDPLGILNPGVKVPVADQRALGTIKYDPALAPLAPPAAAVLSRIERERAYAEPRLALLAAAGAPIPTTR